MIKKLLANISYIRISDMIRGQWIRAVSMT